MPVIRTDDEAMAFKQVWLGFKGFTWWVEWTYARWGVTVLLFHVTGPFFLVLFGLLTSSLILGIAGGLACGIPAAIRIAGWATRGLSYDQPLAYRLAVLREAWRVHRRPAVLVPSRVEVDTPSCAGLSAGATRALR